MTFVLGINAHHADASACLLSDGTLLAAAEEERFCREKHFAGFPAEAIRYCLREARITLERVEHVAVNHDPRAHRLSRLLYLVAKRPDPRALLDRFKNRQSRFGVEAELQRAFPDTDLRARIHYVEHHLAHLASAYFVSPFGRALAVSLDGTGDFTCAAWGVGEGTSIALEGRIAFPHSLGFLYDAVTAHLGFPNYGDEYKVMALAAFGEPSYLNEMRKIVALGRDGQFTLTIDFFRYWNRRKGGARNPLDALLGPARRAGEPLLDKHRNVARSLQSVYEETFFHLLDHLHRLHGVDDLALAGGCAMNSVANAKIVQQTGFKRIYVPPAPGDGGGSIGAALVAWQRLSGRAHRFAVDHAFWGPGFDDDTITVAIDARRDRLSQAGYDVIATSDVQDVCDRTAQALADGLVVGWFQGRMEFGPRALGNRSLLADPRRPDVKDILNRKIKRREPFRPFAPAVLRDHMGEWFETACHTPFMSQALRVRDDKQARIPAVVHVDGTARVQTVEPATNPRFFDLLTRFHELTAMPILLNTSLNENEPIACTPADALECLLRTELDWLAIGGFIVARRGVSFSRTPS